MHKVLKILIASSVFFNFTAGMLGPIYAIFVLERVHGDVLIASSSWAIYTAIVGVLILTFGRFEDKLNKRKIFVAGRAVNVIGIFGYFFVSSPVHLFIVQATLGIAIAMMNPTFEAIYSRGLKRGREAFEWSVWEGSIYITIAIAAIIGGAIVKFYGFNLLFIIMTISALMSFFASTYLLKKNIWQQLYVFNRLQNKKSRT